MTAAAPVAAAPWRPPDDGLRWPVVPPFDAASIEPAARGLWRYRAALAVDGRAAPLSLGEGGTPLVAGGPGGPWWKLDFLQPTGSYKDRGFATLFTALRAAGVRAVVEDSSGNAGASAAAYGAAAGIDVTLCLPAGPVSAARLAQAEAYGAAIDRTAPTRAAASRRAAELAVGGVVHASHVHHPAYLAGQTTLAFELWESLGRLPDDVVVPLGHGGLLLGLALGFSSLVAGGVAKAAPRLHGVQAAAVAPLADAFARDAAAPSAVAPGPTAASGIAIGDPPRGAAVLAAVRASGGRVWAVDEADLAAGHRALARRGWYVEPTSAVVEPVARALAGRDGGPCVVAVLTGTGLKADPPSAADATAVLSGGA